MGIVRWLFRSILWPRRRKQEAEEEPPPGRRRTHGKGHRPGVYRIEVDGEMGRFHGDGPPFSFWASSRIILILSFLLWWIQPAGPMIAGYVGGRRAGSPIKAVVAALLPIFAIYVANVAYAHSFAARQLDFVASLPMVLGDAIAAILPFLGPYKEFMVAYLRGFVQALATTFGMGTNGYLMVIIFAYIGGLIGEQTRREIAYRSGAGATVGVNLVQPILGARAHEDDDLDEEYDEEYDEDEVPIRRRHPARTRARARHPPVLVSSGGRRHRDRGDRFERFRKVPAQALDERDVPRSTRGRRHRHDAEDDQDEDEEVVEIVHTRRAARGHAAAHEGPRRSARAEDAEEEREEPAPREVPERPVRKRSHEEERAIQRFVERALRNYDHSKL